jgi:CheY-like chemotaxis protein
MAEGNSERRRRAVLVVEDDDDGRETLADVVETLGRYVFTAPNGGEALRMLDADGISSAMSDPSPSRLDHGPDWWTRVS